MFLAISLQGDNDSLVRAVSNLICLRLPVIEGTQQRRIMSLIDRFGIKNILASVFRSIYDRNGIKSILTSVFQ